MRRHVARTTPVWQLLTLSLIVSTLLFSAVEAEAQITTNTVLPVAVGGGIFRIQTKFLRSSGDPTGANRELTVLAIPIVLVYGATSKLAVFGVASILDKHLEFTDEDGRRDRRVSGMGDSRVFFRYTVFQRDAHGATFRVAPLAGIQIPTGSNDVSDNLGLLPRSFQLGSGSWSPFVGGVLTRQTFAWQFDASVTYQHNRASAGFRFGDESRIDIASKIRLLPREMGDGLPSFLYANLESNLIWRGRNEKGGVEDDNSGGAVWYIDPGFQFVSRRMVIETAIQIPVVQRLNGAALENDFVFVVSIRVAY